MKRPGWWINEGTITELETERVGEFDVVHRPEFGDFPLLTVASDKPRYIAFRWVPRGPDAAVSAAGEPTSDDASTLTEFRITRSEHGVTLRVVESGFSTLNMDDQARRKLIDDNAEGWLIELAAAKTHVEAP